VITPTILAGKTSHNVDFEDAVGKLGLSSILKETEASSSICPRADLEQDFSPPRSIFSFSLIPSFETRNSPQPENTNPKDLINFHQVESSFSRIMMRRWTKDLFEKLPLVD
jgi:hypothetical protein